MSTRPPRPEPKVRKPDKPVPPAPDDLVERVCNLPGCERKFQAHATAKRVWCTASHRIADPQDTRRKAS